MAINETCVDYDECKKGSSNKLSDGYVSCTSGAACHNKVGGYVCSCKYGFEAITSGPGEMALFTVTPRSQHYFCLLIFFFLN